jgi:transcriptional regulator with XRE-family HTH domain
MVELRELMGLVGWTQADLADRAGVDPRTVGRWVRGETAIPRLLYEHLRLVLAFKRVDAILDGAAAEMAALQEGWRERLAVRLRELGE